MIDREQPESPEVEAARAKFDQLRSKLNAVRIAYANSAPFDGQEIEYEDLKAVAEEVIQAHYELQNLRYGRVRLRLSVSKLLRRGW